MKIADRIRENYVRGIAYQDLLHAVFPEDEYPDAWRYSSNGGPPGCAMAFGAALRRLGASINYGENYTRNIYIKQFDSA